MLFQYFLTIYPLINFDVMMAMILGDNFDGNEFSLRQRYGFLGEVLLAPFSNGGLRLTDNQYLYCIQVSQNSALPR